MKYSDDKTLNMNDVKEYELIVKSGANVYLPINFILTLDICQLILLILTSIAIVNIYC